MSVVGTVPPTVRAPSRHWRQAATTLPRAYIDRQGRITSLALRTLGGKEAAIAFLNTPHSRLAARPVDLAGSSVDGFDAVSEELRRMGAPEVVA